MKGGCLHPATVVLETGVGAVEGHFRLVQMPQGRPATDRDIPTPPWESDSALVSESDANSVEHWRALLGQKAVVVVDLIGSRGLRLGAMLPVVDAVLSGARPDAHVAFLVGTHDLSLKRFAGFQDAIAVRDVEWIIWTGGGREGVFPWLLLVVRPAPQAQPITRIVYGINVEANVLLSRVRTCAARKGGAVDDTIVRREPLPVGEVWTWEALSGRSEKARADTRALGPLQPLASYAKHCRGALPSRDGAAQVCDLEDGRPVPDGHIALITGADIRRDHAISPPSRSIPRSGIADEDLLRVGDVLLPRLSRNPIPVAVVDERALPAFAAHSVLRLRLRDDLPVARRRLLLAYLRSQRFGEAAAMRCRNPGLGSSTHTSLILLDPAELLGALVPEFDESLVEAMDHLASAETRFREWADALAAARDEFFDAQSFEASLPLLLRRSRVADDQVAAAADVDTLDGRIRQRFPHPLAFRFESIQQMDHGQERVRETLACAEHLVLFLAFLGLANLGGGANETLRAWTAERGRLTLDWGKADALLREAAAKTAKLTEPLASPIPELGSLHAPLSDQKSPLNRALREMRQWRNDESHLNRSPPDEVIAASERFNGHLRVVFAAASMLTQTPLVEVEAFERDSVSDEPRARFSYLVGASSVFARRWERTTEADLSAGQVGLRDVHGRFHRLNPWIIRRNCATCKHAETFILSRYESESAKYVAMESGHALSDAAVATKLRAFLDRQDGNS